jgi:Uma2 family endonuclease
MKFDTIVKECDRFAKSKIMTQAVEIATEVPIHEPQEKDQPEKQHLFTFAEYLEYEGEPYVLYELFRGQLIPRPAPTLYHTKICEFLTYKLQRYFAEQNLALVAKTTVGVRTESNSSRIPDAIVCDRNLWEQISDRPGAGVLDFAEKPILVVEIVSSNRRDDYIIKRSEYELAEIPEYWIVDPKKKQVRVCSNLDSEQGYTFADFTEDPSIVSGQFEKLVLSVKELFDTPVVEQLIQEEQAKLKTLEQQAETERQRAETERQRAESERQRAEKLAQRLREMGINPDDLD